MSMGDLELAQEYLKTGDFKCLLALTFKEYITTSTTPNSLSESIMAGTTFSDFMRWVIREASIG